MKATLNHTDDPDGKNGPGRLLTSDNAISLFVFVFFLTAYAVTLCPAVFWWDSGELIANIAVLGIPHRPGFPIYVLLGKLFSFLPLWSYALKVNLLSALFASFSLAVFYRIFQESLKLFFPETARKKEPALISTFSFLLVLGFTYSFWIQAVRTEVYSLNILFFSLLLFSGIQYLKNGKIKYVYLFFFLLGLGLGNHHLSLLSTLPALLALLLIFDPGSLLNLRRVPLFVLFWLSGLSVYLYLPIRSLSQPALAWGEVGSISSSAGSIFALDTIANLNLEFLSDITSEIRQIFLLFYDQLTITCLIISLVALFLLFRRSRKVLAFLLLLIAGNCAAVIFMTTELISTNPDLHGYLVFSVFALAFSFGVGVLFILTKIRNLSFITRRLLLIALIFVSFLPLLRHYPAANLSRNRIAHNYGLSIISGLDSNSILFADNVNLNFILRELHYAEEVREDVTILDRGLLGFDWYVMQMRGQKQLLFSGIQEDLVGETLFGALLRRAQDLGMPTYMEFTERDLDLANYLTPEGYVFRVSENPVGRLSEKDLFSQKTWVDDGPFDLRDEVFQRDWDAKRVFALSFYRLGLFYESKGMISCALDQFTKVRKVDPKNSELILKIRNLEKLEALSGTSNQNSFALPTEPPG
jgi:hypothetical protein